MSSQQLKPIDHAFRALKIRHKQGKWMGRQHAIKHGVMGIYRLILQMEATAQLDSLTGNN